MSDNYSDPHESNSRNYPLFRRNIKMEQLYDKYKDKYKEQLVGPTKFSPKEIVWAIAVFAVLLTVPFIVNEVQKRQSTTSRAAKEPYQAVIIEAEQASISNGASEFESKSASDGKYISFSPIGTTISTSSCPTLPKNTGKITFNINIPYAENYYIWTRIMAPNMDNNSFYMQIDDNCSFVIGDIPIQKNSWKWINTKNNGKEEKAIINLTKGTHKVTLIGRESNVRIDKILFITDEKCSPLLMGDNCINP